MGAGEPSEARPEAAVRLRELFDEHAARLYAYCLRRASGDEADEIIAETFLVAWRRIDAVPEPALPWLFNVARKVIANRRRGERRRQAFLSGQRTLERSGPIVVDPADEVATRLSVLQALESLPSAEREALALTVWEGLDVREGAIAAGCSRATFSVRLHRARKRLMKELDGTGHSFDDAPTAGTSRSGRRHDDRAI